jgi:hypothetical protein
MRRVVAFLVFTTAVAAAVETSYQVVFRRALLRLAEQERGRRPGAGIEVSFSRFGQDAREPRVSWFEDAFEAVRDRVMPGSRLRMKGDPGPVVAYFFADFYEVPADFDRAVGRRGYLWSPRTWSFHPWPG